jgi:hypothetical protein
LFVQLSASPTFDTPTKPPERTLEHAARDDRLHGRGLVVDAHVEVERLFHIGARNTWWRAWPKYSCVIWSSIAALVFSRPANSGDGRLAHLEVDRAVLDLDDDVVVEPAVERMEVVVGGAARDRSSGCASPCDGRRRSPR